VKTLCASEFAVAAGIPQRTARYALSNAAKGKPWRGHHLPVVELDGQQGGASGKVYGLVVDTAPEPIRAKLNAYLDRDETPVERVLKGSFRERQFEDQAVRYGIIEPILTIQARTKERAEAFRTVAGQLHIYRGVPTKLAEPTLREWVRNYETKGLKGLFYELRSDMGVRKMKVTRAWDEGIDLSDKAQSQVVERLELKARSWIANDGTSGREVIRLAQMELQSLSSEMGSKLASARLKRICKLNQKWVARFRNSRLIHTHDKDHKLWQDKAVPRIRRGLTARPMALLMGDVHYVDVLVAESEEPIRVRLIAWLDTASLFAWVTPVFLSKGRGIRQEDVATSLAQVTLCPHGGIPEAYYLDNGSEYAELDKVTARLGALADRVGDFAVHKARAYSPQSKGDIENLFRILQGIYQSWPGYIGGDRTNKKSVNKGKVVQPYTRGLAQLEADIHAMTAIYNGRLQSGRLNGLSPLEMQERKIAETEFVARVPDEESFDIIFSRQDVRTIRQGCINRAGNQYHAPFLDTLPMGDKVEILVPLRNRQNRLFVRYRGVDLGWADALPEFQHGDAEGAKLQSRLEQGRVLAVKGLRAETDPKVSTFEDQITAVERIAPNTPAPERWSRAIDKTNDTDLAQLEEARKRKLRQKEDEIWAGFKKGLQSEEGKASGHNR
jgi:hypothetical protein